MARRPADYTAQLHADQERREQREKQRQKSESRRRRMLDRLAKSYGNAVIAAAGTRYNVDQIAGMVLDTNDRTDADPALMEVLLERGQTFFRGSANGLDRATPEPYPQPGRAKVARTRVEDGRLVDAKLGKPGTATLETPGDGHDGPANDDRPRPEEPTSDRSGPDEPGPDGSGAAEAGANGAPTRTPPITSRKPGQHPDRETPPGAPDLLGGLAPDRPGALPATEA